MNGAARGHPSKTRRAIWLCPARVSPFWGRGLGLAYFSALAGTVAMVVHAPSLT